MLNLGGNNQPPMNNGALNLGVSGNQQPWPAQQNPFGQAAANPFVRA